MNEPHACPKCSGSMQHGHVFAFTSQLGLIGLEAQWIVGASDRKHPLSGYRCEQCGFVELYAKFKPDQAAR